MTSATKWYLTQIERDKWNKEDRRRAAAKREAEERRYEDVMQWHLKDLPPAEQRRIRRQIQMRKLERQLGALRFPGVVVGAGGDHAGRRSGGGEEEETEEEGSTTDDEGAAGGEEDWDEFDREIMRALADFLRPASLSARDFIVLS